MSFPHLPKCRLTQEDIFDPRKDQIYYFYHSTILI
nr:MAG TPA: hypothetical protein [Caudoviricetes sp.]